MLSATEGPIRYFLVARLAKEMYYEVLVARLFVP